MLVIGSPMGNWVLAAIALIVIAPCSYGFDKDIKIISVAYVDSTFFGLPAGGAVVVGGFGTEPGVPQKKAFQIDTGSHINLLYMYGSRWGDPGSLALETVDVILTDLLGRVIETQRFHKLESPHKNLTVAGTIGLPYFEEKCASFDFQSGVLIVSRLLRDCRIRLGIGEREYALTRDEHHHRIFIVVSLGSRQLKLIFDTGAAGKDVIVFDPNTFSALKKGDVRIVSGSAWGREQICDIAQNGSFNESESEPFGRELESCRFPDGGLFSSENFEGADGILGLRQLRNRRFVLDLINNRLVVWPEKAGNK